jgi:hypothetical protein
VTSNQAIKWVLKPAFFIAALGPAGWLVWASLTGNLSPNSTSSPTSSPIDSPAWIFPTASLPGALSKIW